MKKNMKIGLGMLILFCLFGLNRGFTETSCMHCEMGRKLVCIGSPASTVLAKCGSPLSIDEIGSKTKTRKKEISAASGSGGNDGASGTYRKKSSTTVKLEDWTYCIEGSYGSDCYLYVLRFKGSTLARITFTLEKGN